MKYRRQTVEEARKLLRCWQRIPEFGDPIGCIATTFTFDAPFFEEECLARFAGIESDPREDQHGYIVEREERLSQVFACVLVDRAHVAKQRSLRWHLLPVHVSSGGLFHAKVSLLAWRERVRLLVTSANLTEPGYRNNLEQAVAFEFSPQGDLPLDLLRSGLDFLERAATMAPQGGEQSIGPQGALRRFLATVRSQIERWTDPAWPRGEPRAAFIPVFPGSPSLFEQVRTAWRGTGAEEAWVLSPFFDRGDGSREVVDQLAECLAIQGERRVSFYATGNRLRDGEVQLNVPECLAKPWKSRMRHSFHLVHQRGEDGSRRDLHAKGLWFERDGRAVQVLGSSNFTLRGMGIKGHASNVEANVAFILPDAANAFGRTCRAAFPESDPLDPVTERITFLADAPDQTPEVEEYAPLPSAFGLALFEPEGEGGRLLLSIDRNCPAGFSVLAQDGPPLIAAAEWSAPAEGAQTVVPWDLRRPPTHLIVQWQSPEGKREALWVVNVTDTSKLPAPDELRNLNLEELLEILTSARPLHEAVGLILRRRERAGTGPGSVIDPHQKVDTRNFLIRRVRRVSMALEGLRERLERPASGLEAVQWRLHGPIGPLALARRLAEHEPQGAAFMIAEVALTLRQTDWSAVEASIGVKVVRDEVTSVIADLEVLSKLQTPPRILLEYVQECFEEARA
jgi:hypothetical protein